MKTLLSIDWDFFSGCCEHVFDAPIWGSPDLEFDRCGRWHERVKKRGGNDFGVLKNDFPLFDQPRMIGCFRGLPTWAGLTHQDAYTLLERTKCAEVINLDSHHDLFSSSGDAARLRPGNWAGLALLHGLIESYTCVYPSWHQGVRVTEGFDLGRTWSELGDRFSADQVRLLRTDLGAVLEQLRVQPSVVLLVQSPSWTNPAHDPVFFGLCKELGAQILTPLLERA